MEQEPKIIGKNLSPEEKKEIGGLVRGFSEQSGKEKVYGEIEKTAGEEETIKKLDSYLAQELDDLGVKREGEIAPERVHFMRSEEFKKKFPDLNADACCDSLNGAAYVNKAERPEKIGLYKTVLHEMLHLSAFRKFSFDREKANIDWYRTGYWLHSAQGAEKGHYGHFRGLDEAITDKFTFEILRKHGGEIGLSPGDKIPLIVYRSYLDVLEKIMYKIAKKKSESRADIWRRFKKGAFSGEMMHLRDIEDVFGKGALRVVAAMGSATREDLTQKEINENILKYLETEDDAERNRLAAGILNKAERYRYLKRKKIIKNKKPEVGQDGEQEKVAA